MLVRVIAPHFVAGLEFSITHEQWVCTNAAPILRKACVGRAADTVYQYVASRGWTWEVLG